VFCDSALAIEVKDKAALIFDLVESHEEILREKHEVKDLEKYLTMVKNIENFDFTIQIETVTKKLNVVIEANEIVNPVKNSEDLAKSKSTVAKSGKAEKGIIPADQSASILINKMRELKSREGKYNLVTHRVFCSVSNIFP
jgi:hypothetical protein